LHRHIVQALHGRGRAAGRPLIEKLAQIETAKVILRKKAMEYALDLLAPAVDVAFIRPDARHAAAGGRELSENASENIRLIALRLNFAPTHCCPCGSIAEMGARATADRQQSGATGNTTERGQDYSQGAVKD
jgi:hypothetical protein